MIIKRSNNILCNIQKYFTVFLSIIKQIYYKNVDTSGILNDTCNINNNSNHDHNGHTHIYTNTSNISNINKNIDNGNQENCCDFISKVFINVNKSKCQITPTTNSNISLDNNEVIEAINNTNNQSNNSNNNPNSNVSNKSKFEYLKDKLNLFKSNTIQSIKSTMGKSNSNQNNNNNLTNSTKNQNNKNEKYFREMTNKIFYNKNSSNTHSNNANMYFNPNSTRNLAMASKEINEAKEAKEVKEIKDKNEAKEKRIKSKQLKEKLTNYFYLEPSKQEQNVEVGNKNNTKSPDSSNNNSLSKPKIKVNYIKIAKDVLAKLRKNRSKTKRSK